MNSKRCFKEYNEDELHPTKYFDNGSINVNKKLKDYDEFKNCLNNHCEDKTQLNHVNLVVKDLVIELVNKTEKEFIKDKLLADTQLSKKNELINEETTNYESINTELKNNQTIKTTTTTAINQIDLDDSFKLNYDFSLINNSTDQNFLYNQSFETNLNDTLTSVEHNYANIPTTSSNHSNVSSNKSIKGALKSSKSTESKKSVKFKGVDVFYFSRNQGGSTVPSQGGSTLGMEMNHCDLKNFTLDAHQEEKRQVHREILLRQKRFEKMYQKQQSRLSNQSDSEDSQDNISDISDSELDFDSWYFLQPVPVKQRRALLRESGINKIDSSEKEECRGIRQSREFCGCECESVCNPETCLCFLNGIKCQVDRLSFPCGCLRDSCGNLNGRTEFNQMRVKTHFVHTIMRLELEKKNESQQFIDETLNSSAHSHHLKPNSNIEFINQNNAFFSPLTSTINQQPIYNESSNILNCNEVNLTSNEYLYDSGSSSYSSENSNCTSEELDCTLTNHFETDNQTLNNLTFNSLSPFSLISSASTVPVTNNDILLNGGYTENNYHNFLNTDQSFRYYSSTLNNTIILTHQTDQSSLIINLPIGQTINHQQPQLSNNSHHLNYQSFYTQQDTVYSNLDHCYSATQQPDLFKLTMTYSSNDPQLEQQSYQHELHHYADFSNLNNYQSNCPATIVNNDFMDCQTSQLINDSSVIVNNDDSSSSGQSINSNLDNYLTGVDSTQNENHQEDNFGEIIKNTIVESVIA